MPRGRVLIVVVIILVLGFAFFLTSGEKDYVAKFGKRVIMPSEFYVYLYEQKIRFEERGEADIWEMSFDESNTAESVAKQNAIESNIMVKLTAEQSKRYGLYVTSQERDESQLWAQGAYEQLGSNRIEKTGITKEALQNIYEENILYSKTFNEITKNFVLNENDFDEFFEKYQLENRKTYITVLINYIFIEGNGKNKKDLERAEEALALLRDGADFDKTAREFSKDYSNASGPVDARDTRFDSVVTEAAYNLLQGETSNIITAPAGYYIIRAAEIEMPDRNELKAVVEEEYVLLKRAELFHQEYSKWLQAIKIEQNQPVWDTITIENLE